MISTKFSSFVFCSFVVSGFLCAVHDGGQLCRDKGKQRAIEEEVTFDEVVAQACNLPDAFELAAALYALNHVAQNGLVSSRMQAPDVAGACRTAWARQVAPKAAPAQIVEHCFGLYVKQLDDALRQLTLGDYGEAADALCRIAWAQVARYKCVPDTAQHQPYVLRRDEVQLARELFERHAGVHTRAHARLEKTKKRVAKIKKSFQSRPTKDPLDKVFKPSLPVRAAQNIEQAFADTNSSLRVRARRVAERISCQTCISVDQAANPAPTSVGNNYWSF